MTSTHLSAFCAVRFPRLLAALLACFCTSTLHAQINGPGWLASGENPLFSVAETQPPPPGGVQSLAAPASGPIDADYATTEITELARGLQNDPLRIFNFVRNQIRYEHYYGCKKGAALTLLEKSGNDFDQCTLLVSLLREAAAAPGSTIGSVTYKYGMMTIPLTAANQRDLTNWLGYSNPSLVAQATGNGGWPWWAVANPAPDAATVYADQAVLPRVCVEAAIGGTDQIFDPSFKTHTEIAGININTASGYNQTTLLTQAGGTSTATQVSGMNPANLGAHLGALTTTLTNSLKVAPAGGNASVEQVIGGRQIVAVESGDYSSTAYFTYDQVFETWTEIPGEKASTIEVSAASGLTWTAPLAELRGRRLSLTFATASPYRAQIWLDDVMQVEETGTAPGTEIILTTSIYHPFRDINVNQSDDAGDLKYQRRATVSGTTFSCSYAILYAFNPGVDHVRQREEKLAAYRATGLADSTREVRTETLNLMGLQWLRQSEMASHLIDRSTDTVRMNYHRVGRTGQEKGFYVDVAVQYVLLLQKQSDEAKRKKSFELSSYVASALEHGIVEQLQDGEAVSTVDLITRALTGGVVNRIVNGSETKLQPAAASQTVGTWTGTGWASVSPTYVGMIISGNLNGGFGSTQATATSTYTANNASSSPVAVFSNPPTQAPNYGADPVDLATGAFTYDHVDLALGGQEPRGLIFSRHYNTRLRQRDDAKLGYGWTHQYYLRANKRSDGEAAFGAGTPTQAAAALVATNAAVDVYDINDPKKWAAAMLALGWAVDQVNENAVSIQFGDRNLQFLKQPSGAFLPPAGLPASLAPVAGGYELTFRHGNTVVIDANGRGTKIRDPYNKELNLAYNGDGTLNTVTDCYNRVLTLSYTSGKLTGVSDGTGRSVSFGRDVATGTDLATYTDPEGKVWYYDYLAGHRLEKTRDPDSTGPTHRIIVQNIYDGFDRVKEQRSFGDAAKTWKLFYSGSATVEQDPLGGRRTLIYDDKHRLAVEIDASGRRTSFGYDGQDHRTSVTTPNGKTTTTLYNADHNPTLITDPLFKTTQLFYDGEKRLDYTIDQRTKTWDTSFNTFHQPWIGTTPEGVSTELLYYTSGAHTGLLWKRIVEGTYTTIYEYDSNGYVNKITHPNNDFETFINNARGDATSHTDLRGFVTGYSYNKRRQLLITTLPTVNGVSYYLENVYDNAGNLWKQYDRYRNLTTTTFGVTQKPLVTTFSGDPETITRIYDARDWLEKTVDTRTKENRTVYYPDGRVQQSFDRLNRQRTDHTYDDNGRLWVTGTPKPNASGGWATTANEYTDRGELWKTTDGRGVTELTYDDAGNLWKRKNRRNHTWELTYNDDNQLEDTISPITTRRWQKRYDNRGLLDTVTEPSGQVTDHTPDSLGRVDLLSDPLGNIDFAYDDEGRLDTVQESAAGSPLIDRNYDALGRLIKYQHGSDYTLEWIYHDTDPVNKNSFSLKYPDGKLVRYDFDARGRLWKVKDWNTRETTYLYDNLGRLEWTNRPNGTKRRVYYDDAGQITKIEELNLAGKVIALFSYPAYWNNGQPRQQFSVPKQPPGQLNAATMTFDAENRLATWNSQTVVHDDDGNMTNGPLPPLAAGTPSPGMGSFGYDARNRLLSCNGVSYTYDAENLRTKVTTAAGATNWVINPAGSPPQPLVRTKSDGSVTRYVWGLGLLYEVAEGDTQPTKTYHYDRRGSTVALSNSDGQTITDRWTYGAYGERLTRSGTTDTPFQFNGFFGVQTDFNGLLYMNARYCNVELRRFVSADPMGFAESANFYWFANGDPFSLADPFGLGAADSSGFMGSLLNRLGNGFIGAGAGAATGAGTGALVGAGIGAFGAGVGALPGAGAGALAGGIGGGISGFISGVFADPNASARSVATDGAIGGVIDGLTAGVGSKFVTGARLIDNASTPVGRIGGAIRIGDEGTVGTLGGQMIVKPGTNIPATIGGRSYSGHALDQMQGRGFVPSVVENTIQHGVTYPTRAGTIGFYDAVNDVRVIVNSQSGKVVTVIPGKP